jgi:hypothetical protein
MGIMRSVGGAPFARAGDLALASCVEEHGGALYACSWNYPPDAKAVAKSLDGGDHFTKVMRYSDGAGPLDTCPASTPVARMCPPLWGYYGCILGVSCGANPDGGASDGFTGAVPATSSGGGCVIAARASRPGAWPIALLVIALALYRVGVAASRGASCGHSGAASRLRRRVRSRVSG